MPTETVLRNARIVTRTEIAEGAVCLRDGMIVDIADAAGRGTDMEGDFLLPGLVDLHTDNLERHLEPRPGVRWPDLAALLAHDRQIAAAGITTVFDALSVGFEDTSVGRREALTLGTTTLAGVAERGLLKCEHRLHVRCELCAEGLVDDVAHALDHPLVSLVSVMDHTPGQRQWRDLDQWRHYHSRRYSRAELDATLASRLERQRLYAEPNRRALVGICRERGLPLASHDDTTPEHVLEGVRSGVAISEFPTTLDAARLAHDNGLKTLMGAPNVVKGGSHSGNIAAHDLAAAGVLDGLASDYVPVSMIQGPFLLHERCDLPLVDAIAMVSANPAAMVGLDDRGRIAPGLRADLIRVTLVDQTPVVREVWLRGERVM
jgi:alpha-D-ribose 1-methylphosphonate 5-triphosphate diphosphatase